MLLTGSDWSDFGSNSLRLFIAVNLLRFKSAVIEVFQTKRRFQKMYPRHQATLKILLTSVIQSNVSSSASIVSLILGYMYTGLAQHSPDIKRLMN